MIKSISIDNFRAFKNINFELGKYITVIAGHNATGKSTLLGLLGHSAELKKELGIPILKKQFRTEFSEIFKASKDHDLSSPKICTISFKIGNEDDYRFFRITWQKFTKEDSEKNRFRLIPTRYADNTSKKRTEGKVSWPTLYLGLSRLYPLGECDDATLSFTQPKLTEDEKQWLREKYSLILNINSEINDFTLIDHTNLRSKKSFSIKTDDYDHCCNSSGQDNLGQILCALLSFKRLKAACKIQGKPWNGGLLLIDEFDATLHPSAQNKLTELLYEEAKALPIQIVYTTHSLSLLKYFLKKFPLKNTHGNKMIYLTNANASLQLRNDPTYEAIENDMLITCSFDKLESKQIHVYTEDPQTQWFLKNIASDEHFNQLKLINVDFSCTNLIKMVKQESYFSEVLIVVDGDVPSEEIECFPNMIALPGTTRPETLIYEYLINLPDDHELYTNEEAMNYGFSKRYIEVNGPLSPQYNKPKQKLRERDYYKEWFIDTQAKLDYFSVFNYWKKDNPELVEHFNLELKKAIGYLKYNKLN